ncbi:MAG: hypothetical protein ACREX3_06630 [Gammaproteobacteria bacterium]
MNESIVEDAALARIESAGWSVRNGVEIAPGEPAAERDDYGQVVLRPVARMQRSGIRGLGTRSIPDSTSLHPGYHANVR